MKKTKTQQRMFALIDQMYSEDINQKDFCEREDIKYHTLQYWLNHYRREKKLYQSGIKPRFEQNTSEFIPLEIGASVDTSDAAITLNYPNGVRLHLDRISLTRETVVCLQKLISCLD